MNLEELKRSWQEMSVRIDKLEEDNRRLTTELAAGKASSAQQRLKKSVRISGCAGIILPVLAPFLVLSLNFPVWVAVIYAFFGIVMSVLDFAFAHYIGKYNYLAMPIVDSLQHAIQIQRYLNYLQSFGIIVGMSVILIMGFFVFRDTEYDIWIGMLVGFIVGIVFGIKKFITIRRDTRMIRDELKAAMSE